MAQKVLIANVRAMSKDQPLMEIEFPSLAKALAEGYTVKEIVPVPFDSQASVGYTTLIFILNERVEAVL